MVVLGLLVTLAIAKNLRIFFSFLFSGKGFPQCDDSKWYLTYAGAIWQNLTDGLDMNDILYFGYNILLTTLLAIFKDPVVVIFIQAVIAGIGVILVYKISHILFNRTTAIIASLFYISTWDITLWSMYILSDSFFISLLLLSVYLLIMALETGLKKYKLLFAATALYMLVFRPTGIISLVFILIYLAIRVEKKSLVQLIKNHRWVIGGVLAVAGLVGVYLVTGNKFDLFINSLQFNAKKVLYNVYAKGWIYDKPTVHDYFFRSDYKINICNSLVLSYLINNWQHVLILYAKRAVAFLGHWVWKTDLSSVAGVMMFVSNLVPTVLFFTGTIAAIRNRLFKKAAVVWLVILAIFIFCVLVFIDWMYRYRAPAIPFIAIVAAYGADRIIHGTLIIVKRYGDAAKWKKGKC